jgi:hypothetical protein
MKQPTKRVLSGIEERRFEAIAAEIRQRLGVELPGHSGFIEAQGFKVEVHYDRVAKTLTFELLKKPWFVPESLIEQKIDEWLAASGAVLL